jgi:hypothetical protein
MRIGNLIRSSYTQYSVCFNSSYNLLEKFIEDKAAATTGIGDWIANRVAEL